MSKALSHEKNVKSAFGKLLISLCLGLIFSIPVLCSQTITYMDVEGESYTAVIKLSTKIVNVDGSKNKKGFSTERNADFNEKGGFYVEIYSVGWEENIKPDPVPVIRLDWVRATEPFYPDHKSQKKYEISRNGFNFLKKNDAGLSSPSSFEVSIGYGHREDTQPQGFLVTTFTHKPKKESEQEALEVKDVPLNTNRNTNSSPRNQSANSNTKVGAKDKQIKEKQQTAKVDDAKEDEEDQVERENLNEESDEIPHDSTENNITSDSSFIETVNESKGNTGFSSSKLDWLIERPGILGGISVALILMLFLLFRKKKKPSVADNPKETPSLMQNQPPSLASTSHVRIKTKVSHKAPIPAESDRIPFSDLVLSPGVKSFDLSKVWQNTKVKKVFLPEKPIQNINTFVQEKNVNTFTEDTSQVPEIAGFLLGRYQRQARTDQYEVSIDEFVPITPGEQGVYRVEFGTHAWMELDEVQEQFPDLVTIGWFHTHPGHGLFLSQPDLNIQKGFFRQPYHLAMEIDPLKPSCEMAFFTWSSTGEMNNSSERLTDQWYSWNEIMNQI